MMVTGILTGVLFASFVITLLGPLFNSPGVVMQLSLLQHMGRRC